ncbi:hypothetical protein SpCBS45565_g00171 [Spizellomyces sp. 'palustris']|nr:hypothetical protein SpCBS45565_g00171 [Spizellomyces sp. 'palustris']
MADANDFPRQPVPPLTHVPTPKKPKDISVVMQLERLQQLVDINDIQTQLRFLLEEEAEVDLTLDNLMKGRADLENHLKALDSIRSEIGSLRSDATSLLTVLSETSTLAERISGKVRQLDLEQSRVKDTMGLVEDIQELKKCAGGVEEALNSGDYELAGHYICRYLSYDPTVVEKIFSGDAADNLYFSGTTSFDDAIQPGKTPLEVLKSAQQSLKDKAMDEFDNAVQAGNEENILRYFKIFPLVGYHEVGLDKFSAYICGSISRQCQDNMRESADRPQFYAGLLTRLFETIAMVIDRQEAMVDSTYGPGTMLRVIQRLQREADIQSSIILNSFTEKRQLQRKLGEVAGYEESARKKLKQPPTESFLEPREVDGILSEIALISQKTRIFNRFLHVRAEAEATKLHETPLKHSDWATSLDGEGDGLVKVSKLDELTQRLMDNYVSLEEYFIRRSIEKALSIDTYDKNDLTSSCVEDVFFILKTCTRRALSTSDSNCICAIINGIGKILELDYINVFQKRSGSAFSSTETKDGKDRPGFMIYLNNIDVSCDYVMKLAEELDVEVEHLFGSNDDLSLEKIRSCLAVLSEYAGSFRNILRTWIDNLFKQQIKPRLRSALHQAYADINYVLTDDEYAAQEADEYFVKRFVAGLGKIIRPYQKSYSEWNYNQTMLFLIDYVAKDWERYLYENLKFNQFGALLFDKDLRAVSSYLSSVTQWPTRDRFTRLNQISTLLNLDNLMEIYDMWGKSGPITWRLTLKDVRKVLALRVEFSADDIVKLKL